jgi:bacteriorhodopsin|tara:strand:- start:965 stop:1588 length:624 start_codon:yes stop_codon:yes gene_type:complete
MRTDIVAMRHILNLETCISIVAAYFYGNFIKTLEPLKDKIITGSDSINKEELNKLEKEINTTRYVDWMITTPIMLLVLVLALQYNSKKNGIVFLDYLMILLFNYAMLGSGYLGELNIIDKLTANIIGFIYFGLLYGFIYYKYLLNTKNGNNYNNKLLYLSFFILWALYGVFYLMKDSIKNTGYNILDLFSKCFVGIYFWSYSSNIFL